MRRALWLLSLALLGCGDRTALLENFGSDGGAAEGGEPPPCRAAPWLLFQLSKGLSSTGLYAMRADGSQGHALDVQGAYPSLSTDGTRLVYVSFASEADDGGYLEALVLRDFATGTTEQLATRVVRGAEEEETAALTYSAFSPDGRTVAYTAGYDIRAVDIDGTNNRLVLPGSVNAGVVYGHPSYTRDAERLLYGTAGAFGSVAADGSSHETLVTQDGLGGPAFPNPTPSPDGASVASVIQCAEAGAGVDAGATETTLRVYSLAALPAPCSSGVVVATLDDSFAASNSSANPSWGPSGLIAYGSDRDVVIVDAAGGAPRNLTRSLTGSMGVANDPVWAPACSPIP